MTSRYPLNVILVVVFLTAGSAKAQFFTDEYDDESAHHGSPVNWVAAEPVNGEERVVENGSFVLELVTE